MNADMHRARQLSWTLEEFGWTTEILSPATDFQSPEQIEQDSSDFFQKDTRVHFVEKGAHAILDRLKVRSVGWRSLNAMYRLGARLLREKRFELVYISTTNFPLFLLGPLWHARLGIPYVLDIHDPISKAGRTWSTRLSLKRKIANQLARLIEAAAVVPAAGYISVSSFYFEQLRTRYPAIQGRPNAIIPFGVLPRDHQCGSTTSPKDHNEGRRSIIYVGAGGEIMRRSFSILCSTLATLRRTNPKLAALVQIELYGTQMGWRDGGRRTLQEVALQYGIQDLVCERPGRVTYRRSLDLLHGGDGAMILGVDERGYIPSKLFSYAYSGKPLLAVLRKDGPAHAALSALLGRVGVLWFDEAQEMPTSEAVAILRQFLTDVEKRRAFDRRADLARFTAVEMARQHMELFEEVLEQQR